MQSPGSIAEPEKEVPIGKGLRVAAWMLLALFVFAIALAFRDGEGSLVDRSLEVLWVVPVGYLIAKIAWTGRSPVLGRGRRKRRKKQPAPEIDSTPRPLSPE